jgi:Aspartyl protease
MLPVPTALRAVALFIPTCLAACVDSDAGGAGGQCRVSQVADFPLRVEGNAIFAPIRINDATELGQLDTGGEVSVITAAATARLGLPGDMRHGTQMIGVGGLGLPRNDAILDHFELAGFDPGKSHYPVIDSHYAPAMDKLVGAIVGADLLSHFDLDLDVAHKRLKLFRVSHCSGNFLPWNRSYTAVPLAVNWGGDLVTTVKIDGVALEAILDTGASSSVIDLPGVGKLGVTAEKLAKAQHGMGSGTAGVDFRLAAMTFGDMQVGTDHVAKPEVVVLDRSLHTGDMLLGIDYLRTRHVWISYHTEQLFIETPETKSFATTQ